MIKTQISEDALIEQMANFVSKSFPQEFEMIVTQIDELITGASK
jgi:hypothetical protein